MTSSRGSLWARLAELPLVVDGYELERLTAQPSVGVERVTTQIRLLGSGTDGLGEDISPFVDEHDALRAAGPVLPLAGEWTLAAFCDHLAALEQWPAPPQWKTARLYRNWGFESAALDLALRQAGRAFHDLLEREPQPVRFVNSLGLGDPPSTDQIHRRLALHPDLRFKLDAEPGWTPAQISELASTGAVDSIDFKGRYGLEVEDVDALAVLYERVLEAFPHALIEDPHDLPQVAERLRPHLVRVAYDAPIHAVADIEATAPAARTVNVKPSRIGGLRPLFELYSHCQANRVRMYGGGMGEQAVARGQVQLLAALFHAGEPNDVAPGGFNAPDLSAGLPSSPLPAQPEGTGFRRRA